MPNAAYNKLPLIVKATVSARWLLHQVLQEKAQVCAMSNDNEDSLSQGSFEFIGHSDAHSEDGLDSWAGTDDLSSAELAQYPAYFRHSPPTSVASEESISGVTDILESFQGPMVEDVQVSHCGIPVDLPALHFCGVIILA